MWQRLRIKRCLASVQGLDKGAATAPPAPDPQQVLVDERACGKELASIGAICSAASSVQTDVGRTRGELRGSPTCNGILHTAASPSANRAAAGLRRSAT